MTSFEVLSESTSNGNISKDNDYESDDDDYDSRAPSLQSLQNYEGESRGALEDESRGSLTVDKLPGTSLLRSVHTKQGQAMPSSLSNHGSVISLESNRTFAFNNQSELDGVDDFAQDDSNRSLTSRSEPSSDNDNSKDNSYSNNPTTERVPAWKLRQKAKMEAPPPAKVIIESVVKTTNPEVDVATGRTMRASFTRTRGSPTRTIKKTNSSNSQSGSAEQQSWFQKLRESSEEKEKRLKREALMEKQDSSRWGKEILEEDSNSEENDEGEDEKTSVTTDDSNKTPKQKNRVMLKKKEDEKEKEDEEDAEKDVGGNDDETYESDTIKKVKSLIEKSFGSALIAHTSKDKNPPRAPSASAFEKNGNEEETDEEVAPPPKNRFRMMRSAAMTSVRNLQKGLMRGDDDENLNDELKERPGSKIITEEDEDEDQEEEGDEVADIGKSQDKRRSLWNNRGGAVFTSVRGAWGGASSRKMEDVDLDEDGDGLDSKTVDSEPDRLDHKSNSNRPNIFSHIATFLKHTHAKFDPKVWADPEIQATLASIEKLRINMNENRNDYRNETRRREKQIENSILQQKTFLARKLARQMYGYKKDPFHQCVKEVYEKEILIIVHEATSVYGDGPEKDDIDDFLDANLNSLYDFVIPDDNKSNDGFSFGIKKRFGDDQSVDTLMSDSIYKPVNRDSCIPLETRLLRAQHNDWMTEHQMELARKFQQMSVSHMYDLLPELRKDHDKLKAIPQKSVDAKIKELEKSNEALREAYKANVEAQEKLLAIYRERYTPSVDEDDEKVEEEAKETISEDKDEEGEADGNSPSDLPNKSAPPVRPGMWAKNLQKSVRGILGPKKDESEENDKDDNVSEGDKSDDGFTLASPIPGGSLKDKFIFSFASPSSSAKASGILANFTAPILSTMGSDDKEENDDNEMTTNQDSAKDSAAAAWKIPGGGSMDKSSLPETVTERRAKRAAARMASRPDASASSTRRRESVTNGAVTSRSELLERARKARIESTVALDNSRHNRTESPTPSNRSRRSSTSRDSVKDLLAKAGDSRRKLRENDSRMESLSTRSEESRRRTKSKLQSDDLSQHSLHERKPRTSRSIPDEEYEETVGQFNQESLMDIDDFGEQ